LLENSYTVVERREPANRLLIHNESELAGLLTQRTNTTGALSHERHQTTARVAHDSHEDCGLLSRRAQLGHAVGHLHEEVIDVLESGSHLLLRKAQALERFQEASIARRSLSGAPHERPQATHQ